MIDCSVTDRMSREMMSFQRTYIPPQKLVAAERQTLLNPREELTFLTRKPDMRVSIMIAMSSRWVRFRSMKLRWKLQLSTPLQFQRRIFIGRILKGLVIWTWPDLYSWVEGLAGSEVMHWGAYKMLHSAFECSWGGWLRVWSKRPIDWPRSPQPSFPFPWMGG